MKKRLIKKYLKRINENEGIKAYRHFHPKTNDLSNKQLISKFYKYTKLKEFKFYVPNTTLGILFTDLDTSKPKEVTYDQLSGKAIRAVIHYTKTGMKGVINYEI